MAKRTSLLGFSSVGVERDIEALKELIDSTGTPDLLSPDGDCSLLGLACTLSIEPMPSVRVRSLEVVEFLLGLGADPNILDSRHWTPLFYAVQSMFPEGVTLLCKSGAKTSLTSKDGHTPLTFSLTTFRSDRVAKALIQNGADLDLPNAFNKTPRYIIEVLGKEWLLQESPHHL